MSHSTEDLRSISDGAQKVEEEKKYVPRPKVHLIIAWILIAVVLFAFLGMCYWMVAYGKV